MAQWVGVNTMIQNCCINYSCSFLFWLFIVCCSISRSNPVGFVQFAVKFNWTCHLSRNRTNESDMHTINKFIYKYITFNPDVKRQNVLFISHKYIRTALLWYFVNVLKSHFDINRSLNSDYKLMPWEVERERDIRENT